MGFMQWFVKLFVLVSPVCYIMLGSYWFFSGTCHGHSSCADLAWPWSSQEDATAGVGSCHLKEYPWGQIICILSSCIVFTWVKGSKVAFFFQKRVGDFTHICLDFSPCLKKKHSDINFIHIKRNSMSHSSGSWAIERITMESVLTVCLCCTDHFNGPVCVLL